MLQLSIVIHAWSTQVHFFFSLRRWSLIFFYSFFFLIEHIILIPSYATCMLFITHDLYDGQIRTERAIKFVHYYYNQTSNNTIFMFVGPTTNCYYNRVFSSISAVQSSVKTVFYYYYFIFSRVSQLYYNNILYQLKDTPTSRGQDCHLVDLGLKTWHSIFV